MHSLTVIEDCGDVELGKEIRAVEPSGLKRPRSVLDRSIGQFKRGGGDSISVKHMFAA